MLLPVLLRILLSKKLLEKDLHLQEILNDVKLKGSNLLRHLLVKYNGNRLEILVLAVFLFRRLGGHEAQGRVMSRLSSLRFGMLQSLGEESVDLCAHLLVCTVAGRG